MRDLADREMCRMEGCVVDAVTEALWTGGVDDGIGCARAEICTKAFMCGCHVCAVGHVLSSDKIREGEREARLPCPGFSCGFGAAPKRRVAPWKSAWQAAGTVGW